MQLITKWLGMDFSIESVCAADRMTSTVASWDAQ